MGQRIDLHEILVDKLGSTNVYYQPPETVKMKYPCIVYSKRKPTTKYANNNQYFNRKSYTVTVIDRNPDSQIPDRIAALPLCSFDRNYVADNLNHDVFTLYY